MGEKKSILFLLIFDALTVLDTSGLFYRLLSKIETYSGEGKINSFFDISILYLIFEVLP
jgi:hypothetical protein